MIVATIARQKFVLDSLSDAEQLLHIIERATPVDTDYSREYQTYYYPEQRVDVGIEITRADLVTTDEHAARQAMKRERIRAEEEAAEAARNAEPRLAASHA